MLKTYAAVLGASLLCAAPAAAQGDIVAGRAVTPEGGAVAGAEVQVRSARTLVLRRVVTDDGGAWRVVFPDTSSSYEVVVRRIGRTPVRLRVARAPAGTTRAPDAVLRDAAVALEGITASGRRPPVTGAGPGDSRLRHDPTASQSFDTRDQSRFQPGDLEGVAAMAPGATVLESGEVSVGGLPSDQNSVRINGVAYGGTRVPGLAQGVGYATSQSADVSRGGFAGGEVAIDSRSGFFQSPSLTLQLRTLEPSLRVADPAADDGARGDRRLVLAYDRGLFDQRASISVSADAGRRERRIVTASGAEVDALRAAGVSPDSLARLRDILGRVGSPALAGSAGGGGAAESLSLMTRIGLHDVPGGWTGSVQWITDREDDGPAGLGVLTFPSAARRVRQRGWNVGAELGRDTRGGFRHDITFARDVRGITDEPLTFGPGGTVRIASDLGGGDAAVRTLRFGGGGGVAQSRATFWDGSYRVRWRSYGGDMEFQLGGEGRLEDHAETDPADALGSFSFASLAELEAGAPSSFTREVGVVRRAADAAHGTGFAEVRYTPTPRFELRGGARLEGSRFGRVGAPNPLIAERFGVSTSRVPSELRLAPRVAFAWTIPPGPAGRGRWPFGQLSGGAGLFRGRLSPALLAAQGTGAGGTLLLSCVGDATPAPDWTGYGDDPGGAPSACVDGTGTGEPPPATPYATAWGDHFAAPRAWKGNLRWSGRLGGLRLFGRPQRLTTEAQGIRGLAEPSSLDANLDATPRFTLADEGRPVFATSITAAGFAPVAASRLDPGFGRVTELRSDGEVRTGLWSAGIAPVGAVGGVLRYGVTYTRAWSRSLERGADPADPRRLVWGANPLQAPHAVTGFVAFPLLRASERFRATLHLAGRHQAGRAFTPQVGGDVNGDGAGGDPAFVFAPASAPEAIAGGMRRLLDDGPSHVRRCLRDQLGRVAARGSCRGPAWTDLNAELSGFITPPAGRGVQFAVIARNVGGGLDALLHGAGGRRGWGDIPSVDPVLLSVRGFDAAGGRYLYDVNGRFGRALGVRRPFTVELRLTVDLAKSYPHVAVDEHAFNLRRDAATSADSLEMARLFFATPPNLVRYILREPTASAVVLTGRQESALGVIADSMDAGLRRVVEPAAEYLAGAMGTAGGAQIARGVRPAVERYAGLFAAYMRCARDVLSPDQWESLGYALTHHADEHPDTLETRSLWCRAGRD